MCSFPLRFLDWVAESGQSVWQLLPLGPTGPDHSPYAPRSSFAGNPTLISPELLADEGWLAGDAPESPPSSAADAVDFERVGPWKRELLRRAWDGFSKSGGERARRDLEAFVEHPDQAGWLEDWTLYAALKERFAGSDWSSWDAGLRLREPAALGEASRRLRERTDYHRFLQFVFFRQWEALRVEARRRGIELVGDLPYYPAYDSADVWAHPELFRLDAEGLPLQVAGVPPDYFSEDGQRWGNPIFRWDRIAADGYAWWIDRLRANLRLVDRVRLDHFRAYAAYWEIGAAEPTAVNGRWVAGPGRAPFDAARRSLGRLPLLAEDLGLITDDVRDLRRELDLPGMRVLQFGFGDGESDHLPERHPPQAVAYTGTHDNDTLRGWFRGLDETRRNEVLRYLRTDERGMSWRAIEAVYDSPARLVVVPLQDLFELGSEARMNRPGRAEGNWRWRADESRFTLRLASRLRALCLRTARLAGGRSRP